MADAAAQARIRGRKLDERIVGENGRWYAPNCPPEKHGKLTGATYWMCQCDPCSEALAQRREQRKAERAHNDAIIASLAAGPSAPPRRHPGDSLPLPRQRPLAPETGESATQRECKPVADRVEQDGDGDGEPVTHSQARHRLVENPADSPAPGYCIDGLPVPELAPAARAKVQGIEHLGQIVRAYHAPDITAPAPLGGQRRLGHGVALTLDMAGVVRGVDTHEKAEGDSTLTVDPTPIRRYGKRGPSGSRNPTTWGEIKATLRRLGCHVEQGPTHVKVQLPDGRVTTLPSSASDWRSLPNCVSQLRKLGLDVRRPA